MMTVKTKDLVVIFIFAKIMSLSAAFFIFGLDGNTNNVALLAQALSLIIFFGLLLLITKQSAPTLLFDTRVQGPKWGHPLTWIILSILLGFMVRFGAEGIYLVMANAYDHQLAVDEFNELITDHGGEGDPVVWLLIAVALVGAFNEEFIYRRIFLWHFSRSYGVIAGVLITSLMFGAIHWNPVALLAAICMACIYLASGRLWVAVIAHAAGNVFHPLMHPLIFMTTWSIYFNASVVAAIVLCVVMARFVIEIKRRTPLYVGKPESVAPASL